MTIVVGYAPDEHGKDALSLAGMLARSSNEPLLAAATILRPPWPIPLEGPEIGEQEAYVRSAFESARAVLPEDVQAELVVGPARSIPTSLLEIARSNEASLLVLGSSSAGIFGRFSPGSSSSHVLHNADLPVALAPRGVKYSKGDRVERVSLAFGGSQAEGGVDPEAARRAARFGAPLRLVSFVVRPRADSSAAFGAKGDEQMLEAWEEKMSPTLGQAAEELKGTPDAPEVEPPAIGRGGRWDDALESVEWKPNEVLLLGSSRAAAPTRVYLGSRAHKIVRHSPVPVILMPRAA